MKKILIVTDAWHPQVNGVVRTLSTTISILRERGHYVEVVTPEKFKTVALPGYPEIRLALPFGLSKCLDRSFDAIHIATEGPLGLAARLHLKKRGRVFTTAFHTHFPRYLFDHYRVPQRLTFRFLRWFHGGACRVMVPTPSLANELREQGFRNVVLWGRGADTAIFNPNPLESEESLSETLPRPFWLSVGRLSVEKNVDAFLSLDLPGTKFVVGDGPDAERLRNTFSDAVFLGVKKGDALAACYRSADVFVFPSKTDTFGLVNIEAISCGTPVAAFPVTGPKDIIEDGVTGALDDDLSAACQRALALGRVQGKFSWEEAINAFFDHLSWVKD